MNVDAVLQSVEERDKWRRRLALLQATLNDIRARQRRIALRVKRLKQELRRVSEYSDAILEHWPGAPKGGGRATTDGRLIAR
ncbi:MAG TPA: hypothetical protein VGV64_06555 [Thermoplasmata archaeon]|nr:hypothetical protein [Thermoplasmata archaeon]